MRVNDAVDKTEHTPIKEKTGWTAISYYNIAK